MWIYDDEGFLPLVQISAAEVDTREQAEIYWYHTDQVGIPRELRDARGEICWQADYKARGNTLKVYSPTLEEDKEAVYQPLHFQGQYQYAETGLHYNRFRYYDQDVGRFISQDPIGLVGGLNLYQYAPNALGWLDPRGLSCRNSEKRFNKRNNITKRYVSILTGKKPSDVSDYLASKGWVATYPQSSTPLKTQYVVFVNATK